MPEQVAKPHVACYVCGEVEEAHTPTGYHLCSVCKAMILAPMVTTVVLMLALDSLAAVIGGVLAVGAVLGLRVMKRKTRTFPGFRFLKMPEGWAAWKTGQASDSIGTGKTKALAVHDWKRKHLP